MDFTPVPRRYAWTEFRSSLEADWACTLDTLHIQWEYEPATFLLDSGELYCPDFWLPEVRTFIEVKGDTIPRRHKPRELAEAGKLATPDVLVLLGLAPVFKRDENGWPSLGLAWREVVPGAIRMTQCPQCSGWFWTPISRIVTCRKCGAHFGFCHLAGPGEITFRHSDRSDWTVIR